MRVKPFFAGAAVMFALTGAVVVWSGDYPDFTRRAPGAGKSLVRKDSLSIGNITDSAAEYHKKVIKTEGTVSSKVKTKRHKGKQYTIFKMRDPAGGAVMLVYLKGFHRSIKKGDRLSVRGRYYEKRKYLFITLKNVLKGREFEILG
ncbi:MAG: hypothetical protein ACR2NQ_00760 [Thermodesulfobacteriota bacterium]